MARLRQDRNEDRLVGTIEVRGQTLEVLVSHYGSFDLTLNGSTVATGYTLNDAEENAKVALAKKKVRVSVPYLKIAGTQEPVEGTATGRNVKTGHISASEKRTDFLGREEKKPVSIDRTHSWGAGNSYFTPEMTVGAMERLRSLREQAREIEKEAREIEGQWALDVGDAVDKAIEEAAKKEVE